MLCLWAAASLLTVWSEECAAEVESLLDVDTDGGALQHTAHLLSNAHEPGDKGGRVRQETQQQQHEQQQMQQGQQEGSKDGRSEC